MAWASFRIKRNHREGNVAYFSQHFMGPWNVMKSVEVPDRNRFLVRSWHGRVSAVVNGTLLVRDDPLPPEVKLAPDAVVGFGAYVDENEFTVRYRAVELRRLTSEPPSLLP